MPLTIWNRSYDRPRVAKSLGLALPIAAVVDSMDAFHVAFNAFKRKLGFATSRLPSCHFIPMWKHLSGTEAARYSALDALALWRNQQDIEAELKRTDAWSAYVLYNLRIDPALDHMSATGMLVDRRVHRELRTQLRADLATLLATMNAIVPDDVKSPKIWKSEANAIKGKATLIASIRRQGDDPSRLEAAPLYTIPSTKQVTACGHCGMLHCKKAHVTRKFARPLPKEIL